MQFKTSGVVLKEQNIKESDRLITILTSDLGIIKAFVKGAKNIKSSMLTSTGLLCYSDFNLYKGKESYNVNSATANEVFFELREDISALSCAMYLAQIFTELSPWEEAAPTELRLLLNSLYFLSKDRKKSPLLIKSIAELRLMSEAGYMPDLNGCALCNKTETILNFIPSRGVCLCDDCKVKGLDSYALNPAVLTAMRFIIESDFERIFDFELGEENIKYLSHITEDFISYQIRKNFDTLDFLHGIIKY